MITALASVVGFVQPVVDWHALAPELVLVAVASLLFSLAMTWWPSRGASRVPVADALRYE